MVEGFLWSSRNRGNVYWIFAIYLVALVCFIAGWVLLDTMHTLAIALIVLCVVITIVTIIISRKLKWHNSQLIFLLKDDGFYFTQYNGKANSYFSESFSNIQSYKYTKVNDTQTTVTIYFKQPVYAGIYGNIKQIQMVKIENFETFQKIFAIKGIPLKND